MSKQKRPDGVRARSSAKETTTTVAEGSQQPRAPGWVAPGGANVQSANIEQQGAALRSRGALQGGFDGPTIDHQRGGSAAQQAGWSARQSAQRMQERGEQDRLNGARQSGHGSGEQQRKEGAQESAGGPAGSMQSGAGGARQQDPTARPASAIAGRPRSKDGDAG